MERIWDGSGHRFQIPWGGRSWTLDLEQPQPGLVDLDDPGKHHALALSALADVGRRDEKAFGRASLTLVERSFDRVVATYRPEGWHGLTVRASWEPFEETGIDLLVHLQADSVDQIQAIEVEVSSSLGPGDDPPAPWSMEAKDDRHAALASDGREPNATIHRVESLDSAWVVRGPTLTYVECVSTFDRSRRMVGGWRGRLGRQRTALFGHHLEKGVVLRARIRALLLPDEAGPDAFAEALARFLAEPPPLGT